MARNKGAQAIDKRIQQEVNKWIDIICMGTAIVLWEQGWRRLRIGRTFVHMGEAWEECAKFGTGKSMLQMVEEETGIEMRKADGKSWHDYSYLNSDLWNGKPPRNAAEYVAIQTRMLPWIETQMYGTMILALHRKEGWGFERISRYMQAFDELRAELGDKPIAWEKALQARTDMTAQFVLGSNRRHG